MSRKYCISQIKKEKQKKPTSLKKTPTEHKQYSFILMKYGERGGI